jgi:DNA-binding NtrC family response regulator
VDDEPHVLRIATHLLSREGYEVRGLSDPTKVLDVLREDEQIGLVLLDIRMPQRDGMDVLGEIKRFLPGVEVVMVTAHGNVDLAVEAIRTGSADFVTKPFTRERLVAAVERAAKMRAMAGEVARLRAELTKRYQFEGIVGDSPAIRRVCDWIARAAQTDATVLLLGESGVGKDLVARTIHAHSARAGRPFLAVNCAALPRELIESELFGHVKGAFTGAEADSLGIFRAADGGTVFLDEVVEMPSETQAKLLRVLQDRCVRPVGGVKEQQVDVRVIAATNRDIEAEVAAGRFRQDLYYRVAVISFSIPSLAQRREDIPALVDHFIGRLNRRTGRGIRGIEPLALAALQRAPWPGNVRQLENAIEHAFAMAGGDTIRLRDLPPDVAQWGTTTRRRRVRGAPKSEEEADLSVDAALRAHVASVLARFDGNVSRTARALRVSRKRLYGWMRKWNLR